MLQVIGTNSGAYNERADAFDQAAAQIRKMLRERHVLVVGDVVILLARHHFFLLPLVRFAWGLPHSLPA